jgi:hypothetical protein
MITLWFIDKKQIELLTDDGIYQDQSAKETIKPDNGVTDSWS